MKKLNAEQRWEQGIDHDNRTVELFEHIRKIDKKNNYCCDLRFGGDGDDGENLMYLFDIYFQEIVDGNNQTKSEKMVPLRMVEEIKSTFIRRSVMGEAAVAATIEAAILASIDVNKILT